MPRQSGFSDEVGVRNIAYQAEGNRKRLSHSSIEAQVNFPAVTTLLMLYIWSIYHIKYYVVVCEHPREVIQYQEDMQLEREEAQGKVQQPIIPRIEFTMTCYHLHVAPHQLKYMEQDYGVLAEKLDKEKESHATTAGDLHVSWKYFYIDISQSATRQDS